MMLKVLQEVKLSKSNAKILFLFGSSLRDSKEAIASRATMLPSSTSRVEREELIDYDFDNNQFNQPSDPNTQLIYQVSQQELIILGKHYDSVQIKYIKKSQGLGANSIGSELTNNKLLTAAAVKKLIDNNMKSVNERLTKLEANNQLQANQVLENKIAVLEKRCQNIIPESTDKGFSASKARVCFAPESLSRLTTNDSIVKDCYCHL